MKLFDISRIRNLLQPAKSQKTFDRPSIFYHEDDFRQVEIVPYENFSALIAESRKAEAFAKEHFDGSGFTGIYVRKDQDQTKLYERKIDPKDLEQVFNSLGFDRISNVFTGYGRDYREQHKDCVAFGVGSCAVFYDFKDNVVEHIWLVNHWRMDKGRLAQSLLELGQKWNVLLQDWNLTATVDLKDKNSIDQYLNTYANK